MATQQRKGAHDPAWARRARQAWPLLPLVALLSCGDRRTSPNHGGAGAGGAAGASGAAGSGGADAGAEVSLPPLNMTMRLSKGAEVLVGGRGGGVRILLEPRARSPRLVEISPEGADSVPKGASSLRDLRGGGRLRYGLGKTSGSSGPEVELVGELSWGGRSYLVICRAQGEEPSAAEWCLPYLDALRLTEG